MISRIRPLVVGVCVALFVMQAAAADSPREHFSLDAHWEFHLGDDWQAQPNFNITKFVHAGDNVIAVGVNNNAGWGGLNLGVIVNVIGHASVPPWSRSLFNGLAQIIVQSMRDAGEFKLTASADGLKPATTVVKTLPCKPQPSVP